MRPKLLTLEAFGPFATRQQVDFEALPQDGVVLICGETGAGKTTLFDALSFALYGKVSGGTRGEEHLGSDFAPPGVQPFVELTFVHQGAEYLIRRSPKHRRPLKTKEGWREQPATALLHTPDRVLEKGAEVDRAIEELLGLSHEQFQQIIMIAQGDFLRLLLAKSDERGAILRRVFSTQGLEAIQRQLKEAVSREEANLRLLEGSLGEAVRGLRCPPEKREDLEQLTESLHRLPEVLAFGQALVAEGEERRNWLEKEKTAQMAQRDHLLGALSQAVQWNEALEALSAHQQRLAQEEPLWQQSQREAEAQAAQAPARDALKLDIATVEKTLPEYQRLTEQQQGLAAVREEALQLAQEREKAQQAQAAAQEGLAHILQRLEALEGVQARLGKAEAGLQGLLAQGQALEALKQEYTGCTALRDAHVAQQEEYKARRGRYHAARDTYQHTEERFYAQQAGILAEGLAQGQPCPVCGATSHPSPSPMAPDAPTQQQLQAARQAMEKAQAAWQQAGEAAGSLEASFREKTAHLLQGLERQLGQAPTWDNAREALVQALRQHRQAQQEATAALEAAQRQMGEHRQLVEEEKALRQRQAQAGAALLANQAQAGAVAAREAGLQAQVQGLAARLSFAGETEAREHLAQQQQALAGMEQRLQQARARSSQLEQSMAHTRALVESGRKQLEQLATALGAEREAPVALEPLQAQKAQVEQRIAAFEKEAQQTIARLEGNRSLLEKIAAWHGAREEAEERLQGLKRLSDTAGGTLPGKPKIAFETYVQQVYFDQVLQAANQRLFAMTDGRYRLLRRQGSQDLKTKAGLLLDIADAWTGQKRGASSMSGGESFMASLSLALGLSDVVQQMAGGIALETLFIDEGFGTLDSEALDRAMDILSGLVEGNRLVAVISHVEELRQRMDRRIVVVKGRQGSTLRMEAHAD